ncbi:alpha/beta fold hydrolase [Puerhibacterium sp. TATVAM-FAB25]|uniref:alpha/beta fold hydrolase n=1 Tax=Puerhibacterium sp. TATVAM-FAB25 TaxID=3093699 RepID=UPI003979E026
MDHSASRAGGAAALSEVLAVPTLDGVRHEFVQVGDLRMHVALAGPTDPTAASGATPVLLLHGFPEHWWQWRAVIPLLATDRRVICPDLRGCGWTDAPRDGYDIATQVADVVGLLDAFDLQRVHLVGHECGALVALRLALDQPERVASVVSMTVPHLWIRWSPRLLATLRKVWFDPLLAIPGLGPLLLSRGRQRLPRYLMTSHLQVPDAIGPHDEELYLERLRDPARARASVAVHRDLVMRQLRSILRGAYTDRRLEVPTVALLGAGDSLSDARLLGGYEGHAAELTIEILEDAGHFLPEERPERVADAARSLFARAA